MAIPFSDSSSLVFDELIEKKTQILKSLPPLPREISITKIRQSTSTATTFSSYSKTTDSLSTSSSSDTSMTKSTTDNSNYDLSYYFEPCTTVYDKKAENEEDNANDNVLFRGRSLSIGSTLSSHFINNTTAATTTATAFNKYHSPGIATQDSYRTKSDKSNKKALQFFGEQVKLEITAKDIRKGGLKALLDSTAPLGYFLYHLLNEYSSENLVNICTCIYYYKCIHKV